MIYAAKYRLEWIDYFGQDAQLLIDEQETAGAYTDIKGTRSPITLTYDTPSDFLLEPINGSMMTIRLVAQTDFQFLELYTANNRKYRVTLNIDSSLYWQGFIMPDQYQEEYKGPPYVNEFIAADQLGYLKTLSWDDLGLTSPKNDLQILETVLGATDLEFDLQEGVNIYETNHNSTSADSPLDQTYTDVNVFDGKTYYDVLYHTLYKYQAIIKQCAGEWFIYRPREATAAFNLRKWTNTLGAYSYDSVQSYDPIVLTTSATVAEASLVRIPPDGSMWIRPAWGRYSLTHNMGIRDAFNENHDFTQWSGYNPTWWSKFGSVTHGRVSDKLSITGQITAPGSNYFLQAKTLDDDSASQRVRLYFDYEVYVYTGHTLIVYFEFQFDNAKWFDPDSSSWSNTQKRIIRAYDNSLGSYPIRTSDTIEMHTPAITGFTPNVSYTYLHVPTSTSVADYIVINEASCTLKNYVSSSITRDFDSETDYSDAVDVDNNYKPDDIEMLVADGPGASYPNAGEIWDGVLFLNGGKSAGTYTWTADGRTDTLVGLMKSNFSDFFQYPQQVLSIKVYTKSIDPCTVIREINNTTAANKYFMVKRASWQQQEGYWEVEAHQLIFALHEVVSPGDAKILSEDDDYILLEDGNKIIRE